MGRRGEDMVSVSPFKHPEAVHQFTGKHVDPIAPERGGIYTCANGYFVIRVIRGPEEHVRMHQDLTRSRNGPNKNEPKGKTVAK